MKLKYLFFTLLLFYGPRLLAQNDSVNTESKDRIIVLADGRNSAIQLRWAPSTLIVWQLGNRLAYQIERTTIMRNGQLLADNEAQQSIVKTIVKPLPEVNWTDLIAKNEQAEIVQEMIYGQAENTESSNIMAAMKRYDELNLRFGFALFICDQYADVAKAAALSWLDVAVKANEHYLYRISLAQAAPEGIHITDGTLIAQAKDAFITPSIKQFSAAFADKKVDLSWSTGGHTGQYSAYQVERSSDSIHFSAASPLPIAPLIQDDIEMAFYTDSLPDAHRWFYRIVGLTPFGTEGSRSNIIGGQSRKPFEATVQWESITTVGSQVYLSWQVQETEKGQVGTQNVLRSTSPDGPFLKIMGQHPTWAVQTLASGNTQYTCVDQHANGQSAYYMIELLDRNHQQQRSSVRFLFQSDSIPPAIPEGLQALSKTNGEVLISWKSNREPDQYAYRLFRANSLHEEFKALNSELIMDTFYTDTIMLRTLTKSVYYKVLAMDNSFNQSETSEAVELIRPDIIPPVPPVFTKSGINQNGMFMYWEYGPSDDVNRYELYRINIDSLCVEDPLAKCYPIADRLYYRQLVDSWIPNPLRLYFADTTAQAGNSYQFILEAIDHSGNRSGSVSRVFANETGKRPKITNLKGKLDREKNSILLTWNAINEVNALKIDRYLIYRQYGSTALSLYKAVKEPLFNDLDVIPNDSYTYKVKALFENGAETGLSSITISN